MNTLTSAYPGHERETQSDSYRAAEEILKQAGILINGHHPWDMKIKKAGVFDAAFSRGNLGLGEAYSAGAWEAEHLDEFFNRLLSTRLTEKIKPLRLTLHVLVAKFLNRQSVYRSQSVAKKHYDLGNDFYEAMLDSRMTYTCGYWDQATSLEMAQEAKLDMVCRKLQLQPGMRLLDIGCGWGSLMAYASEKYGVQAVGVSISKEQIQFARQRYSHLPLDFRFQDYRTLDEKFDAIASIGMFEHVGRKNFRNYMRVAQRCLSPGGLFLLHTIGKNNRDSTPDPWIDKYIFPNGDLPSLGQIGDALDGLFVVEDLHNFGADYDKTLMAWHRNFEKAWPRFSSSLGDHFYRIWRYYLLSCAGAFRARDLQLWQLVLSKNGVKGGYKRPSL